MASCVSTFLSHKTHTHIYLYLNTSKYLHPTSGEKTSLAIFLFWNVSIYQTETFHPDKYSIKFL